MLPLDFPDPHIVRDGSGVFHAYATQGFNGPNGNKIRIQHSISVDATHWTNPAECLPTPPKWCYGAEFWAPFVMPWNGKWLMYYCCDPDTTVACPPEGCHPGLVITVSVADRPEGPFVEHHAPLLWSRTNVITWSVIDPFVDADGWLWYGFGNIRRVKLSGDRLRLAPDARIESVLHPTGRPHEKIFEAAEPLVRHGRRLLFVSGDMCCGPGSRYGVSVAVDISPDPRLPDYKLLGDVLGRPDSLLLRSNELIRDPGHHCIFTDDDGQDWIAYHGKYMGEDRTLCIDRIYYDNDGWPHIETGSPSVTPERGPVIRLRENTAYAHHRTREARAD